MRDIYLTFDVEDFINQRSLKALQTILNLLEKYKLKGIFFISGHVAEKISNSKDIINSLNNHAIGYHSSGHSVIPIIPMFTDIENYNKAVEISYERETSHINPLTVEIEGEGGIKFLREIFPEKEVISFRAPGHSWSPPHLEALKKLGIKFDFSTNIAVEPVIYGGINFYSLPTERNNIAFLASLLKQKTIILRWHPDAFVNSKPWDTIYHKGNPDRLYEVEALPVSIVREKFNNFEQTLKKLCLLEKMGVAKIQQNIKPAHKELQGVEISKEYNFMTWWAKTFYNYYPKFLQNHLIKYFTDKVNNAEI